MNNFFPSTCAYRWSRAIPLAVLLACAWLLPGKAMAENSCWIDGTSIEFGTVGVGGTTTSNTLRYTCQNDGPAVRSFRLCLYMDPILITGVAPRRMINWGSADYLNYDLYSNPAMTQLVGSTTSGNAVYSVTLTTTATGQTTGSIPLYSRVPAGQNVTAGNYFGYITEVLRTVSQSGSTAPTAAQCASATSVESNYTPVTATFANTCYISTATDLEFGSVANLATPRNQTSAISLRCPNNTSWQVALNYGSNANGTTRRMLGPGSNYITYQLYQDASRTQVWGNTTTTDVSGTGNNATQTLTVYGRTPVQTVGSAGAYSDTVTITLTY